MVSILYTFIKQHSTQQLKYNSYKTTTNKNEKKEKLYQKHKNKLNSKKKKETRHDTTEIPSKKKETKHKIYYMNVNEIYTNNSKKKHQ